MKPNAAWQIALGREGQVFVNPYTGEITGEGATKLARIFSHDRRFASLDRTFGRRATNRQSNYGRVQFDVFISGDFGNLHLVSAPSFVEAF